MTTTTILPVALDLTIYKDRDYTNTITILKNGVALDLTGYTIDAQVREGNELTSTLILTFTGSHNDSGGVITLFADKTDTKEITVARGRWDMVLTNPSDNSVSWIFGKVTIKDVPTSISA